MAFVEVLRQKRTEALANNPERPLVQGPLGKVGERRTSFIESLRRVRAEAQATPPTDPWRLPLERVRGKTWDDGIERISTQTLFDLLEVPQRRRNAGTCRRLAKIMRELGWMAIKARGLTQGGFRDQVRGWARDKRQAPLG